MNKTEATQVAKLIEAAWDPGRGGKSLPYQQPELPLYEHADRTDHPGRRVSAGHRMVTIEDLGHMGWQVVIWKMTAAGKVQWEKDEIAFNNYTAVRLIAEAFQHQRELDKSGNWRTVQS